MFKILTAANSRKIHGTIWQYKHKSYWSQRPEQIFWQNQQKSMVLWEREISDSDIIYDIRVVSQ